MLNVEKTLEIIRFQEARRVWEVEHFTCDSCGATLSRRRDRMKRGTMNKNAMYCPNCGMPVDEGELRG